jgi:FkbM family methyltransferase
MHMRSTLGSGPRLIHRALRYRFKLNRAQIGAMLGLLPRGGVGIDIGAHKGAYSFWMARAVGRGGRVLAFEPQETLARTTAHALRALRLRQVELVHAAVSDRCGPAKINVRSRSSHGASMEEMHTGLGPVEEREVDLITVDEAVRRRGLTRVDFVKIDVEGHEMAVLRGAADTLRRLGPAVLVELESRHHGGEDPVRAAAALMAAHGYRGHFYAPAGMRPLEEFEEQSHQRYGTGEYCNDFLFVRDPL